MPASNKADIDEMKEEIKGGLEFYFVQDFEDVMKFAFQKPSSDPVPA